MFLQLMFVHEPIKFLIVSHNLDRIIKNLICIHIFHRSFPLTFSLCYLIHSIITYSPSINIKIIHIFIKKIARRIKLIQSCPIARIAFDIY